MRCVLRVKITHAQAVLAATLMHILKYKQYGRVSESLVTCALTPVQYPCHICYAAQVKRAVYMSKIGSVKLGNVRTLDTSSAVAMALSLAGVNTINEKSSNSSIGANTAGVLSIVRCKLGRVVTVVRVLPHSELVVPFEYTAECSADRDIVITDMA
jgi:hypothetical protein